MKFSFHVLCTYGRADLSVAFLGWGMPEMLSWWANLFSCSLQIILALGNYMNSSKRGAVYGFKLQSLDLVSGIKEIQELYERWNSWQRLNPGAERFCSGKWGGIFWWRFSASGRISWYKFSETPFGSRHFKRIIPCDSVFPFLGLLPQESEVWILLFYL